MNFMGLSIIYFPPRLSNDGVPEENRIFVHRANEKISWPQFQLVNGQFN